MKQPAIILAALLCMASRHPDRMPRSDLVLNCSYNRGDATDRSWNAKNGTLQGNAVVTAGQRYLTLDGSGDYVDHGDDDDFSFTDGSGNDRAFTVMAWVKLNASSGNMVIAGKSTSGAYEWIFRARTAAGTCQLVLLNSAATTLIARRSNVAPVDNVWTHIAAVYSGGETVASISVFNDGALQSSVTDNTAGTYTGMSNTAAQLQLGVEGGASAGYFKGDLDDVRIYNRALTAAEVAAIYAAGRE